MNDKSIEIPLKLSKTEVIQEHTEVQNQEIHNVERDYKGEIKLNIWTGKNFKDISLDIAKEII